MRAISFGINYWSKVCEGTSNTEFQIFFQFRKNLLVQFKPNNQQAYLRAGSRWSASARMREASRFVGAPLTRLLSSGSLCFSPLACACDSKVSLLAGYKELGTWSSQTPLTNAHAQSIASTVERNGLRKALRKGNKTHIIRKRSLC